MEAPAYGLRNTLPFKLLIFAMPFVNESLSKYILNHLMRPLTALMLTSTPIDLSHLINPSQTLLNEGNHWDLLKTNTRGIYKFMAKPSKHLGDTTA